MPNYRLHARIFEELSTQIKSYADRFVHVGDEKFPLTAEIVQGMILPTRELALLDELAGLGYVLPTYGKAPLTFTPEMHGVRRTALVIVYNPNGFRYKQKPDIKDFRQPRPCLITDMPYIRTGVQAEVPPHLRAAVVKWVDNAVAAARKSELVHTLTSLLSTRDPDNFFATVGHCARRWPTLVKLGEKLNHKEWAANFANPPTVNLKTYQWPHVNKETVANIRKMIDVADTVIAGGMMLPPAVSRSGYEGNVSAWMRDPSDWTPEKAIKSIRNITS